MIFKKHKRKKKHIYALYQFVSFVALIFLLAGVVIVGYMIFLEHKSSGATISFTRDKWMEGLGNVMTFSSKSKLLFPAAFFIYLSFTLFIFSWFIGTRIFYCKNRTLFDSLFLVFMMIPVLANVFALISQFVEKEFFIAEAKIDKTAIIEEQTRLIRIEIAKEKKKINRIKARQQKELEKLEADKPKSSKNTTKKTKTKKTAAKKPVKKTTKKPATKKKAVAKKKK